MYCANEIKFKLNATSYKLQPSLSETVSFDKVSTLYWLPKLHRNPYKARFIANSSSCTTTQLSKVLTSCLKAVKMLSSTVNIGI